MNEARYPTQAKIEESLRLSIVALLLSLIPQLFYLFHNVVEFLRALKLPLLSSLLQMLPTRSWFFLTYYLSYAFVIAGFLFALSALLLHNNTSAHKAKQLLQTAMLAFALGAFMLLGFRFIPRSLYPYMTLITLLFSLTHMIAYGSFFLAFIELTGRGSHLKTLFFGALIWEISAKRIFYILPHFPLKPALSDFISTTVSLAGLIAYLLLLGLFITQSNQPAPKRTIPTVTPQEDLQDSLKDLLKKK